MSFLPFFPFAFAAMVREKTRDPAFVVGGARRRRRTQNCGMLKDERPRSGIFVLSLLSELIPGGEERKVGWMG